MESFETKYGKLTFYQNDKYFVPVYQRGDYWDESTMLKLKEFIDPNRNILEIGGHCGESSLCYSSFLNEDKKLYVYEAQHKLYELLVKNIKDSNLEHKIIPYNKGVFCFNGRGNMNLTDLETDYCNVIKRYNEENNLPCNFAGLCLGNNGESIELTTIDSMGHEDIGFIHSDAQGAENFIFSKGTELIARCRPVILYENKDLYGEHFYNIIKNAYPQYENESKFDIKKYCMETLGYSKYIDNFNGGIDTVLFP